MVCIMIAFPFFKVFSQFSLTLESRHEVSHPLFIISIALGFVLVHRFFYFCQCNFCNLLHVIITVQNTAWFSKLNLFMVLG